MHLTSGMAFGKLHIFQLPLSKLLLSSLSSRGGQDVSKIVFCKQLCNDLEMLRITDLKWDLGSPAFSESGIVVVT